MADDLDERHAAAIEIERGRAIRIREAVVQRLAGVLLEVDADDADPPRRAARLELERPAGRERAIVLRDLITLGQVGIEVVLPGEDRGLVHRRSQAPAPP